MKVIVDIDSGTWFDAETCRIICIPDGKEQEWSDRWSQLSDNDRAALGAAWGYPVIKVKDQEKEAEKKKGKGDRK